MMRSSVVLPRARGPEQRHQLAVGTSRLTSSRATKLPKRLLMFRDFDAHESVLLLADRMLFCRVRATRRRS